MKRPRRALRWVLLVGPCRLYLAGEATGGAVPFVFLAGMFATAMVTGGIGALWALITTRSLLDGFTSGAVGAFVVVTVWAAYALLVLAVLWILGRSPDDVVLVDQASATGRHSGAVERVAWRKRGEDNLIPGSLVAFFAIMLVFALAMTLSARHSEQQFKGAKSTAQGQVLRWDDGGWLDVVRGNAERHLVVRFAVNGRVITSRMSAEDVAGTVPRPGESLMVVRHEVHDALRGTARFVRRRVYRPSPAAPSSATDVIALIVRVFGSGCH